MFDAVARAMSRWFVYYYAVAALLCIHLPTNEPIYPYYRINMWVAYLPITHKHIYIYTIYIYIYI